MIPYLDGSVARSPEESMTQSPGSPVRAAYAECRRLVRRHYENFPVASRLVPPQKRDALAAIYAFARSADDFADEPGEDHRLEALAQWRHRLRQCYEDEFAGRDRSHEGHLSSPDAVFIALGHAVAQFRLSQFNFENLLQAFESDVRVKRHPDFASLLDYCACSANPVGRLVLELFDHRDPELFALSDFICTGLQLTNFWQDVAIDLERGRVYLPLEDLVRFNISVADVEALKESARARVRLPLDDRWRQLMAFEVSRAREFLERGRVLAEKVTPDLRLQLRLTYLGGVTILDKIEEARYDVFRDRPQLGRLDSLRLFLKAWRASLGGRDQFFN